VGSRYGEREGGERGNGSGRSGGGRGDVSGCGCGDGGGDCRLHGRRRRGAHSRPRRDGGWWAGRVTCVQLRARHASTTAVL